MRFTDLLKRAFNNLYRNKARSILTILASAIGTSSVITMVSVAVPVEDKIINKLIDGANLLRISAYSDKDLTMQNVNSVRKNPGIKYAALTGIVEYQGYTLSSNVKQRPAIAALDLESFKLLESQLYKGQNVKDINGAFVSKNFFSESQVNTEIKLNVNYERNGQKMVEIPIRIDGVLKDDKPYMVKNILPNEDGAYPQILYIPLEKVKEIQKRLKNQDTFSIKRKEIIIEGKSISSMDNILNTLERKGLEVNSTYKELKDIKNYFMIFQLILGILGAITLIISTIGTANTMNMSVMERRKEIGIIKAIGCKLSHIRLLFAAEAVLIGVIGGIFGVFISFISLLIINSIFKANVPYNVFEMDSLSKIPILVCIIVVFINILVNIIASASAVNKAVRVDVVTVLKEE